VASLLFTKRRLIRFLIFVTHIEKQTIQRTNPDKLFAEGNGKNSYDTWNIKEETMATLCVIISKSEYLTVLTTDRPRVPYDTYLEMMPTCTGSV
jgi:hypothetical protein